MLEFVLIGLGFGIGYAAVNHTRRSLPLSLLEELLGGVFGIADNADTAPDALHEAVPDDADPADYECFCPGGGKGPFGCYYVKKGWRG